ncbi:protein singles bar-like [Homarus americanus]|uniref:protein singles bar-like n=1 Tax=Homarus americanus TaxID=6706 RepID=UPI001C43EABE|nr:protein singles bar-like [Homarus americanus]XP_042222279.1 protein singles bar-like [Homarus americanus]XP_042222280.1 protein singles bar-like [Homarus americanus]
MRQGPSVGWSSGAVRPTVIQPSAYSNRGGGEAGINCICCTCCSCIHLGVLRSKFGWLKIIQLFLSAICLSLTLNYGLPHSSKIGESFTFFLVTISACIFVVCLLTFCYIISANSFQLIRSSVLEIVFNTLACILYLTSSAYVSWSVQTFLWIPYLTRPYFTVYPAMTAAYALGLVLGVVHGIDAWLSYKQFPGRPC